MFGATQGNDDLELRQEWRHGRAPQSERTLGYNGIVLEAHTWGSSGRAAWRFGPDRAGTYMPSTRQSGAKAHSDASQASQAAGAGAGAGRRREPGSRGHCASWAGLLEGASSALLADATAPKARCTPEANTDTVASQARSPLQEDDGPRKTKGVEGEARPSVAHGQMSKVTMGPTDAALRPVSGDARGAIHFAGSADSAAALHVLMVKARRTTGRRTTGRRVHHGGFADSVMLPRNATCCKVPTCLHLGRQTASQPQASRAPPPAMDPLAQRIVPSAGFSFGAARLVACAARAEPRVPRGCRGVTSLLLREPSPRGRGAALRWEGGRRTLWGRP
ncbi:hypothetical protein VDGL01_05901 [Verticillium dahliae]